MQRLAIASLAVGLCASSNAWAQLPPGLPSALPQAETLELPAQRVSAAGWAKLDRLIGSAACHRDSQCKVLAVGRSACGGPQRHLAWSTAVTSESKLLMAAARIETEPGERNPISTCAVLPESVAACALPVKIDPAQRFPGRCVLQALPGATTAPR